MLEGWGDFYLLVGTAAATLIGLLFVVVTLTEGHERNTAREGHKVYMTPIVTHLLFVLMLSSVALVPRLSAEALAGVCLALALIGLGMSVRTIVGIRSGPVESPFASDLWGYGVAPAVLYAGLVGIAALSFAHDHNVKLGLAAVPLLLLLVSVRNAWDLVTWLAPKKPGDDDSGDENTFVGGSEAKKP